METLTAQAAIQIITVIVSITASYFTLKARMEVQEEKLRNIEKNAQQINEMQRQLERLQTTIDIYMIKREVKKTEKRAPQKQRMGL